MLSNVWRFEVIGNFVQIMLFYFKNIFLFQKCSNTRNPFRFTFSVDTQQHPERNSFSFQDMLSRQTQIRTCPYCKNGNHNFFLSPSFVQKRGKRNDYIIIANCVKDSTNL